MAYSISVLLSNLEMNYFYSNNNHKKNYEDKIRSLERLLKKDDSRKTLKPALEKRSLIKVEDNGFFQYIKSISTSYSDYQKKLLEARVFLLEEIDDKLFLSAEQPMLKQDISFLKKLFKKYNLGEIKDREITIKTNAYMENLFYSPDVSGSEAFSSGETWNQFCSREQGMAVDIELLEPYIAKFIKTIVACGVSTSGSCDGNHDNINFAKRMIIDIDTIPSQAWYTAICEKYLAGKFELKWRNRYKKIVIPNNQKYKTYIELNKAAEYLFNHKDEILHIRKQMTSGNEMDMVSLDSSLKEVEERIYNRACTLFDERL